MADSAQVVGRLRLLATSDLHMHLIAFDEYANGPDPSLGLHRVIPLIKALQNEAGVTTLLCDNGDFLQGTPMADHLAETADDWSLHPLIKLMNSLGYDAVSLGNHDFDYGLPFLQRVLTAAEFPAVSANLEISGFDKILLPYTILEREITTTDAKRRPIRIGITGVAPPQIAKWDRGKHRGAVETEDIISAAQRVTAQMRAAGADLIICLSHSGLGPVEHHPLMENAAIPLAALPDIDALVMGHTHNVFPDPRALSEGPVDHAAGTVHGTPTVMPDCYGRAIGVIDLDLAFADGRWQLAGHHARNMQPAEDAPTPPQSEMLTAAHEDAQSAMATPIADMTMPLHTHFAGVRPDMAQQLLARALYAEAQAALKARAELAHPLLVATAPYLLGTAAPAAPTIDLCPGPLTLRELIAICPYRDQLTVVVCRGAQLRNWLERAAARFNQIMPDGGDQNLINPQHPGYNFDVLHGLRYRFDLSQPARFGPDSQPQGEGRGRVQTLTYQDQPVEDDALFYVATNSYRANGGGGFPAFSNQDILYQSDVPMRDILRAYLEAAGTVTETLAPVWEFVPVTGSRALFDVAPSALAHLSEAAGPAISQIDDERGQGHRCMLYW